MKITTEAYDINGQLLLPQEYIVVSSFACDFSTDPFPEPIAFGFWVANPEDQTKVLPIYLTQTQLEKLRAPK